MFSSYIIKALAALGLAGVSKPEPGQMLTSMWGEVDSNPRNTVGPELDANKKPKYVPSGSETGEKKGCSCEDMERMIDEKIAAAARKQGQQFVAVLQQAFANPKAYLRHNGQVRIAIDGAAMPGNAGKLGPAKPDSLDPVARPATAVEIRNDDSFYDTVTNLVHNGAALKVAGWLVVEPSLNGANNERFQSSGVAARTVMTETIQGPAGGTHPIDAYFQDLSGYSDTGTLALVVSNGTLGFQSANNSTFTYSQPDGTDVVDETKPSTIADGSGTLTFAEARVTTAPSNGVGDDKGFVLRIRKVPNGSSTPTNMANVTFQGGDANDTIKSLNITTPGYSDGDKIEVFVDAVGTVGTQAQGVILSFTLTGA